MRENSELMVITKAKDIVNYSFAIAENAPKKFRFTLITRIHNTALDILESLILANEILLSDSTERKIRKNLQHKAVAKLKILDALIMTAREQKCILPKQYEVMSRNITDCLKLTRAWINSDNKRY